MCAEKSPLVLFGSLGALTSICVGSVRAFYSYGINNEALVTALLDSIPDLGLGHISVSTFPYLSFIIMFVIAAYPRIMVIFSSVSTLPEGYDNEVSLCVELSQCSLVFCFRILASSL
eukprot:TRINITY_DN2370_c0_g1_i1.p1 TRINITY_DN2370_c0_g1~~TRINITY_DN2370_c0_g1_i1.p1  ORF type:complete len:117 (-),score=25.74 TRINITY_DN2370_c0_g1_i1:316-666(-)